MRAINFKTNPNKNLKKERTKTKLSTLKKNNSTIPQFFSKQTSFKPTKMCCAFFPMQSLEATTANVFQVAVSQQLL